MDLDDTNRRQPWTTPELRHTDATTTAAGTGPYSDGLIEASTFTISVQ